MTMTWLGALTGGHVLAALAAVALGAAAMRSPKRSGRHPRLGRTYLIALSAVAGTGIALALTDWPELWPLAALGAAALASGAVGYAARRRRPRGWVQLHIIAMAGSYTAMLTAFYVDNGPRLPGWNLLPDGSFWFLPIGVATPLTVRAVWRNSAGGRRARPAGAVRSLHDPAR